MGGAWGARAKLARAQHHLHAFDQVVSDWHAKYPNPVRIEYNDERTELQFLWHFEEVPDQSWAAIVGDLVHNLRSALDHLAWQLVVREGGQPGRHTGFPITTKPEAYGNLARKRLRGITDAAVLAKIERLQPFHPFPDWTGPHPLFTIDELDRIDKHQTLHFVVTLIDRQPIHGAPFAGIRLPEPASEVEVEFNLAFEIALRPGLGTTLIDGKVRAFKVLSDLGIVVARLLDDFNKSFFQ